VLLVSAGLLLRSLASSVRGRSGFDASHLLTMQVQYSGHRFDDDNARRRFLAQTLEAVHHVPGVAAAAFTSLLPLSGDPYEDVWRTFRVRVRRPSLTRLMAMYFAMLMTPGLLRDMGIALRRGRLLDEHDTAGAPQAVLISESLAKSKFAGRDPIGQRMHIGPTNRPWYSIVGVVDDVKQTSLAESTTRGSVHHAVPSLGS
jgi:putative ABC transport system permease protein